MRHLGLFAFGVTTCVLVPTALHVLEAGPAQIQKLVAPGARSITIGGAKVDVAVDRALVDPGDKIHVTLTASAAAPTKTTVELLVFEATGTDGGRVESPPNRVARQTVTLDVKDQAATKTLAFTLPGFRGEGMEGRIPLGHYTVLVMSPADADRLDKLRRGAVRGNPMAGDGGAYEQFETAYYSIAATTGQVTAGSGSGSGSAEPTDETPPTFGAPGGVARLDIHTRPQGSPVTIVAPETGAVGEPVAVTVRITNPTKHALADVSVSLAAKPYMLDTDYLGLPEDQVDIAEESQTISFKARETRDLVFHVSAKTAGVVGLVAYAHCDNEACYTTAGARKINDSALEAVEFTAPDAAAHLAAK